MEALDPAHLAAPVRDGETARLFSSAADGSKTMLADLAPKVLGDLDHGFFLRVNDVTNGVEATLAEVRGPGAFTWFWSANPVGELRLYVDDERAACAVMPMADFLLGKFAGLSPPWAGETAGGLNLHFPIPHRRYARIAIVVPKRENLAELFYQIAWRALPAGSGVESFNPEDVRKHWRDCAALSDPVRIFSAARTGEKPETIELDLPPGAASNLFTRAAAGAITRIVFDAPDRKNLRDLELRASWDDPSAEPAMDCSLSGLAGVSTNFEMASSLPAEVRGSTVDLRWFMPWQQHAELACVNRGGEPHRATVKIFSTAESQAGHPLYFHARELDFPRVPIERRQRLSLLRADGAGRIAGCALRVEYNSPGWWGEGDPMIWLDDDQHAAWQGTGTEDHFGFAWCSLKKFDHLFRGQSLATDRGHGFAAMRRCHLLDVLPFQNRAAFDFEAVGLEPGFASFNFAVIWYGGLQRAAKPEVFKLPPLKFQ